MSVIRSENKIAHATINFIRSRKFLPLSCTKTTPKYFPIEAVDEKKLSSTVVWKYLDWWMNKWDTQLKSSLIIREPQQKLKKCKILNYNISNFMNWICNKLQGVSIFMKSVYANVV